MRLFRRQGYASTGLQQILDEAGVPKGSLYHHFPGGKEALAEAAVGRAGGLVAELLEGLVARHGDDPRACIGAYCRQMAAWMEESEFRSGCPIATTMLETVPQSPALARAGNAAMDRWIEILTPVFGGAGDGSARRRAQTLIAAMEGALLVARVRSSTQPILDLQGALSP